MNDIKQTLEKAKRVTGFESQLINCFFEPEDTLKFIKKQLPNAELLILHEIADHLRTYKGVHTWIEPVVGEDEYLMYNPRMSKHFMDCVNYELDHLYNGGDKSRWKKDPYDSIHDSVSDALDYLEQNLNNGD